MEQRRVSSVIAQSRFSINLESELSAPSVLRPAIPATPQSRSVEALTALDPRLARVLSELFAAVKRDRAFVAIAVTYWLGSVVVGWFVRWPGVVAAAGLGYAQVAITSATLLAGFVVFERLRARRDLPPRDAYCIAWRRLRARHLSDARVASYVVACVLIPLVVACFTGWKVWLNRTLPFAWDTSLAAVDYKLHGGHYPWELLQPFASSGILIDTLVALYTLGWFGMLHGITVWQALAVPSPRRSRFLIASALAWPVAGNLLAGAYMSAGPWFEARLHPDGSPFLALGEQIARISGRTQWAQNYLFSAYQGRNSWEVAAGISAMPSMHLVIATIIASFLWGYGIVGRMLGTLFVVSIFVGSVVLGWHYAVDGYAGIVAGLLLWSVAGQVARATHPD
jgi:hypothetical protein